MFTKIRRWNAAVRKHLLEPVETLVCSKGYVRAGVMAQLIKLLLGNIHLLRLHECSR